MNEFTLRMYAAMTAAMSGAFDKRDREEGQGTIEYLGIIVVIALLIVGVASFVNGSLISDVTSGISDAVSRITSAG